MGVDLCTAHNWGPCGQLPGLKTWGAHQELATRHGGMFGGMDVLVSMTWMNVLMPRCLLSLVILLEISPTYRWKIYLTRKNAHKKLDQKVFGHSRKEDNLLPKPCKTKDSLWPQHATNWEIVCTNWEAHLLIGKSIQRDMLNSAFKRSSSTPSF